MEYKASSSDEQKLSSDEDDTWSCVSISSVKVSCGKGDCAKVFERILDGLWVVVDFRGRGRDGDPLKAVVMDSSSASMFIGTVLNVESFELFAKLVMTCGWVVLKGERRCAVGEKLTDVDMKEVNLQQCRD